ncbi:hypothetical protein NDU88_001901 [Pleurodeles waltl]|uniref:Uncharacterized protein n=1 Tax=Pleurodeles waltl TaxID=8319 RepID=A0AAV7WJQ8_PLEWA|nr:hypothetical protein NDU88_001901 [Pleurodeles waltl]
MQKHILQNAENYLQGNSGLGSSDATPLDVYKSVMQGQLVTHIAGKCKEREKELRNLENQLTREEADYVATPATEQAHHLEVLQEKYRTRANHKARALFWSKKVHLYEVGSKVGKLLT